MALTKAMLRGMSLTEEQISAIMEGHNASVTGLMDEIDSNKKQIEAFESVQRELDALKKSKGSDEWKSKYEQEHSDFEAFKTEQKTKDAMAAKNAAFRKALVEIGVSEKRLDSVMRVSADQIAELDIEKDGSINVSDDLKSKLKTDWSDFIMTSSTKGASTDNPPGNDGGADVTKEQFNKMGYRERVKLFNESPDTYHRLKGE